MTWLVNIPVWGEPYLTIFETYTSPALKASISDFGGDVRLLFHTDDEARVRRIWKGYDVEIRPKPNMPSYEGLIYSHGDAIKSAEIGQRVCLLNADIVISKNLLKACDNHINNGKMAVVTSGIRTALIPPFSPPIGEEPRELLKWAWEHRHQIIKDLEWGTGRSTMPTNLFFTNEGDVVLRGFHLHPVAIVKHKVMNLTQTIDGELLNHYSRDTIHVVTSPDDLSMLEITQPLRRFQPGQILEPNTIAIRMKNRANELHRWLFTHRIVVVGTGEKCNEYGPVRQILEKLGYKA